MRSSLLSTGTRALLFLGSLLATGCGQGLLRVETSVDEDELRRRKCGDGRCQGGETCSSCEVDCGACAPGDPAPDSGELVLDAGPTDSGFPDAGPTDSGSPDAGPTDSGLPDAGPIDSGKPDAGPADAGPTDSGTPDASVADSGTPLPDAGGPLDSGALDAGPWSCGPVRQTAPANTSYLTTQVPPYPQVVWSSGANHYVEFWEKRDQVCTAPDSGFVATCTALSFELMATEIGAAGQVSSTARKLLDLGPLVTGTSGYIDDSFRGLDAVGFATGFAVTWVVRPGYPANPEVWYALFDTQLNLLQVNHFEAPGAWNPNLAGDGQTLGLLWEQHEPHQTIHFTPLYTNGTRGPEKFVTQCPHQINGELGWDGTQFAFAFECDREAIRRCGCPSSTYGDPTEVFVATLAPDGTTLVRTLLSEGIEEGMNFGTGVSLVERLGGGFVVSWVSSLGGRDVVAALVAPDGSKVGANHKVTFDGEASVEITPFPVPGGASGFVVVYGHTPDPNKAYGVRAQRLDAQGTPLSPTVQLLPAPPSCDYVSTWENNYYPTGTLKPWCYDSMEGRAQRMAAAGTGGGGAFAIWPAQVRARMDPSDIWSPTLFPFILYGAPLGP